MTTTDRMCNVCGGSSFEPAPLNRLAPGGKAPMCSKCRSLERHRIFRVMFDHTRTPAFRQYRCLQFSSDPSIALGWFGEAVRSMYGGQNHLDIQDIAHPNDSFDVVVCNHIIEHVPEYRKAIRELARITRPSGFVFLSFPTPYTRLTTEDWGYPRPEQHGHYRLFGRDIEGVFRELLPAHYVLALEGVDPVTESSDMAYVLTRSKVWRDHMLRRHRPSTLVG